MPIMIGNRDDLVTTTAGHSIAFKAGEESFVPDVNEVVKACEARGHSVKKSAPAPTPAPAKPETVDATEKKAAAK